MVAAWHGGIERKQKAGLVLLAIGGVALILQVWAIWLEAGAALGGTAAASFGWMATVGMAALETVDFFAFHPNGVLLGLTRVLLLCWPMAVMIAGVVISRKGN